MLVTGLEIRVQHGPGFLQRANAGTSGSNCSSGASFPNVAATLKSIYLRTGARLAFRDRRENHTSTIIIYCAARLYCYPKNPAICFLPPLPYSFMYLCTFLCKSLDHVAVVVGASVRAIRLFSYHSHSFPLYQIADPPASITSLLHWLFHVPYIKRFRRDGRSVWGTDCRLNPSFNPRRPT